MSKKQPDCKIQRTQILGDPADMGTEEDIIKEFEAQEAEEKALCEAEAQEEADRLLQEEMAKRGKKGLKKIQ